MAELGIGNKKVENNVKPFGKSDKIGYMLGDVGNNMFFSFIGGYLMLYYTDVVGLSGAAVGIMFVIARIWDAINDPMAGTFMDSRPAGKSGKFKQYILMFIIPVVVTGVLTFTTIPGLSDNMKLVYAYITYIAFGMSYTCINIPYGSLASVMTKDPLERTSLSTWRSVGGLVGNILIMAIAPILIFKGEVATQGGFIKTALLFAVIGSLSYFATYKMTTERIIHKNTNVKIDVKKSILGLGKNMPLLGIMLSSSAVLVAMFLNQALSPYLFKDYFKDPGLITVAGIVGMISMFIVLPFLNPLVKKYGKKELCTKGLILSTIIYVILFIVPISNPYIFIGLQGLATMGIGFFNVLIWALVSDAIDYQEYLSGRREEGIVYSSYSFVRKIGQAIAGGIGGFALTLAGYVNGVEQTAEVALTIKRISTFVPAVTTIIAVLALMFMFTLTKEKLVEFNRELDERRETE